ncbi:MAG: flagellar assembly peptidoglycan hydrolase FlgJ [Panacagrimonas sp.]
MALPTPSVTDFSGYAGLRASARANDPEAVKKAAQQFEALFTQQILKSARAAKLGDDILGGGQTDFYQDLFDQQMAMHLSSGKGLGLADMLVKQLMGSDAAVGGALPRLALADRGVVHGESARRGKALSVNQESPDPVAGSGGCASRIQPTPCRRVDKRSASTMSAPADAFIDQIRPHAERAARELGVPVEAIMAQAALETGWGRHVPLHADGRSTHNYFGIKATQNWDGARIEKTTHEHLGGRMQKVSSEFRAYDSPAQAFDDYVDFLKSNPRYTEALKNGTHTARFAQGLQAAGYATDPDYADKLLKLANSRPMNTHKTHTL